MILNLWKSPEAFCRQTLHVEVSNKTSSHQNSCTALLQRVQSSALHIFRAVSSLVHFSCACALVCSSRHNLCPAPFLISRAIRACALFDNPCLRVVRQSVLARCSTIRACALLDCVPERVWRRLHALYPVHRRAVEEKRCHTSCSTFSTVSAKFSLGNRIYGYFIMIFLQLLSGPFQWLGSVTRQTPFVSSRHHSPHFIKVFI